ncbi:hypothetical protein CEN45_05935 [Fischerella thermalis CCMEE 5198]|jgi:hypothetical protein|nr:hypothetical protein CEN45_05935 [Fischerella thermalis CCMEE 5198]PMB47175.1 hypothetical protein CEN39_24795 [Fischerella thermalis CCMEE 5201]
MGKYLVPLCLCGEQFQPLRLQDTKNFPASISPEAKLRATTGLLDEINSDCSSIYLKFTIMLRFLVENSH